MEYHRMFPDLSCVYLEDSWVLQIAPNSDGIGFRMETVLTSDHALYQDPEPGEQYCYRRAWLFIRGESVEVSLSGLPPATDASGEADLGNIDVFAHNEAEDVWVLEGDWGSSRVHQPRVTLQFD